MFKPKALRVEPLVVKVSTQEKKALEAVCTKLSSTLSAYVRQLMHSSPEYQAEFEELKESA